MTNLYDDNLLKIYEKKKKNGLLKGLLPLIIVLPLFVLFNILVKSQTVVLYTILCCVDLSIFAFNLIYQLLENIGKSNDQIKHFNNIKNKQEKNIEGDIISISKILTIKKNIKIMEIEIKSDSSTYKVYFNIDLCENPFKVDNHIKIISVENFIKEYEIND